MIQDLWRIGITWDERVSPEIEMKWKELWSNIKSLEKFRIDRWIGTADDIDFQVHGFSDASSSAYGAVLYVRAQRLSGKITSRLLVAKARVAPIKTLTIPRLELSAAELMARLLTEVKKAMEWRDVRYMLWTDSSVVLHWIRKLPCNLKTYVANRVASIQSNTDINKWRHINTKENPAQSPAVYD